MSASKQASKRPGPRRGAPMSSQRNEQPKVSRPKKQSKKAKHTQQVVKIERSQQVKSKQEAITGCSVNGLEGAVDMINSTVSMQATPAAVYDEQFNPFGIAEFFFSYIEQVENDNPDIFIQKQITDDIYPAELWAYLWVAAFSLMKCDGVFAGNGGGKLPSFDSMPVPQPIAYLLSYLRPYSAQGVRRRMIYDLDLNSAIGSGKLSALTPFYPASRTTTFSAMVRTTSGNRSWLTPENPQPTIGTWSDFIENRLNAITEILSKNPSIKMVPGSYYNRAPSPAAYSGRTASGRLVSPHGYLSEKEWQLCQVFSLNRPDRNSVALEHPQFLGQEVFDWNGTEVTVERQIASNYIFLLRNDPSLPWGDSSKLRYRKQKVNDLLFSYKPVAGTAFNNIFARLYGALRNQNLNFTDDSVGSPDTDGPYGKFCIAYIIFQTMFARRITLHSPIRTLALKDFLAPTTANPQAFSTSGFPGLRIPMVLEDFFNSHGVVCYNGHITVPYLLTDANPTDPSRQWLMGMGGRGPAIYKGANTLTTNFPFGVDAYTAGSFPEFIVGDTKYDLAEAAAFTAEFNLRGFNNCMPLFSGMTERWNQMLSTFGSILGNLVVHSSKNEPYGAAWQMLTYVGDRQDETIIINPNNPISSGDKPKSRSTGVLSEIRFVVSRPGMIQSAISLNAEQVLQAFAMNTQVALQLNGSPAPYGYRVQGSVVGDGFIAASMASAFTANLIDPATDDTDNLPVIVRGREIPRNSAPSSSTGMNVYHAALCAAASATTWFAPYGCGALSGLVGGAASSWFSPLVGSVLGGATMKLCNLGLASIADHLSSRANVTSAESRVPKHVEPDMKCRERDIKDDFVAVAKVSGVSPARIASLYDHASKYMKLTYADSCLPVA